MTEPQKKTHKVRPKAEITVRYLADYMAASEQMRRSILRGCKYQPIARVVQHNDAKAIITEFLASATKNLDLVVQRLETLKAKICDSQFEYDTNQHNCDYVQRFIRIWQRFDFREVRFKMPGDLPPARLNGTRVIFSPDLIVTRLTRRNILKVGVAMLRYSKKKPLRNGVGDYQSAFAFGYLKQTPILSDAEPGKEICLTLDAYSGIAYPAPGNSIYRFNEMKASCEGIAAGWDNIQPPKNAVL